MLETILVIVVFLVICSIIANHNKTKKIIRSSAKEKSKAYMDGWSDASKHLSSLNPLEFVDNKYEEYKKK